MEKTKNDTPENVTGPYEIERKFLIEYPSASVLGQCRRLDIMQTYLVSDDGTETRVRQIAEGGSYKFFKTSKQKLLTTVLAVL